VAGIFREAGTDPEALVGGEGWDVWRATPPTGKGSEERAMSCPPPKVNYSLGMACFDES